MLCHPDHSGSQEGPPGGPALCYSGTPSSGLTQQVPQGKVCVAYTNNTERTYGFTDNKTALEWLRRGLVSDGELIACFPTSAVACNQPSTDVCRPLQDYGKILSIPVEVDSNNASYGFFEAPSAEDSLHGALLVSLTDAVKETCPVCSVTLKFLRRRKPESGGAEEGAGAQRLLQATATTPAEGSLGFSVGGAPLPHLQAVEASSQTPGFSSAVADSLIAQGVTGVLPPEATLPAALPPTPWFAQLSLYAWAGIGLGAGLCLLGCVAACSFHWCSNKCCRAVKTPAQTTTFVDPWPARGMPEPISRARS